MRRGECRGKQGARQRGSDASNPNRREQNEADGCPGIGTARE